jgi:multicomponent K+:H+ antiporter subunit E
MRLQGRFRWLPTPIFSVFLFLVWLLLNNSASAGHVVLGVFFALVIPMVTFSFRDPQPMIIKPGLALKQLCIVLWDIVVANLHVFILVLGSNKKLRPAFVKVPIDLTHDLPITILASSVSLTPGTVSAEVYPTAHAIKDAQQPVQRYLLIHVLDLDDEHALIQRIKQRYETPLKEIFQC